MNDEEAHEYYANPEHLTPAGPARKRAAPRLTDMASVRFDPAAIKAAMAIAAEEGITVSSWIRKLVAREIKPPRVFELHVAGEDEPLCIPEDAMNRVMAALMPALMKHGPLDLRIGTLLWRQDGEYCLTSAIPVTAAPPRPQAGAERPAGLIEDSGRRGEPRALPSSLRLKHRTFSCPHMSVGNVASVACEICGPLESVA